MKNRVKKPNTGNGLLAIFLGKLSVNYLEKLTSDKSVVGLYIY